MRNYSKTVGALAAASALVAGNASAEIEGEVHVGYANMYEFRFIDFGNSLIETGVDLAWAPSADSNWGFNVGAWYGSFDAPNGTMNPAGFYQSYNNDELDLYAGTSYTFSDLLTIDAGYIYYYFGEGNGKTQEVYLGASGTFWTSGSGRHSFGYGSTYFYDFDANNGWYWDNKLNYSFEINACTSLDFAAGFGYAEGHGGQPKSYDVWSQGYGTNNGMQGWYVSAQIPWQARENLTITPYVKYTDGDSGLQTGPNFLDAGQQFLIGGLKVAVSF